MLSRDLIIDASAIINLIRSQMARSCLHGIEPQPSITPAICSECRGRSETAAALKQLIDEECLQELRESITADDLLGFMEQYDLGAGESEGILMCLILNKHLWCDDRRARKIATDLLTKPAVIGTLGILRDLVSVGVISTEVAFEGYQVMRDTGGVLPDISVTFFEKAEF